jgi:hypothetical protein
MDSKWMLIMLTKNFEEEMASPDESNTYVL